MKLFLLKSLCCPMISPFTLPLEMFSYLTPLPSFSRVSLQDRRSIFERFHSMRSLYYFFKNTGLSMTNDIYGNEELLSPLRGSRRFLIPTPPSSRKKKKRGTQTGLQICLPYGPLI
jgi:hypothetical protein